MTTRFAQFDAMIDRTIKQLLHMHNVLPATTHPELLELGKRYGLEIVSDVSKTDGDVTFEKSTKAQQALCYELLEAELRLYDPEVIRSSQLQRLILCINLKDRGQPLHGLAEMGRFVIDTLILNAVQLRQKWETARATFHHELFHAIDYRDDMAHFADSHWRKLNGQDFDYNQALQFVIGTQFVDVNAYFPKFNFQDVTNIPAGFLNTYGTEAVYEDKAVVYSYMLVRYADLHRLAASDRVLASKIEYMKELLAKFHPSYDNAFWERINARSKHTAGLTYDQWQRKKNAALPPE